MSSSSSSSISTHLDTSCKWDVQLVGSPSHGRILDYLSGRDFYLVGYAVVAVVDEDGGFRRPSVTDRGFCRSVTIDYTSSSSGQLAKCFELNSWSKEIDHATNYEDGRGEA